MSSVHETPRLEAMCAGKDSLSNFDHPHKERAPLPYSKEPLPRGQEPTSRRGSIESRRPHVPSKIRDCGERLISLNFWRLSLGALPANDRFSDAQRKTASSHRELTADGAGVFGINRPCPFIEQWLAINTEYSKVWPNITVRRDPPLDSKEWEAKPGKEAFFSPKPGQGN